MFKKSALELKNVRCLAITGVLIAAYIVLKAYATVDFGPTLRIHLGYVALATIGMLFGPVVAMLAAIPCDLLSALLRGGGGGILWGLTLVYVFQGLVYGVMLYGFDLGKSVWKSVKLILAQVIVIFISQMVMITFVLYSYGFIGGDADTVRTLVAARVVKNVIEFPLSLAILYAVLVPIKMAYKRAVKS